jgi:hypothetical protein
LTHRIAAVLLATATATAGLVATAGPASAASLQVGTITNPEGNGTGVLYLDDGGYCEPGVGYSPGKPVGTVPSCRGNPNPVRIEVYPISLGGTWDPFTLNAGGLAVEAPSGSNIGDLSLPSATSGGIRLTGKIASTTPVGAERLHVNLFQLLNTTADGVGGFGSFYGNRGNEWTTGWILPGSYLVFLEDRVTGNKIQALVDFAANTKIDIDLDATCFGFDTCAYTTGGPSAPGGGFHPLTPARLLDTRSGTGIANGPIQPGDGRNSDPNPTNRTASIANHELKVTDVGGVPTVGVSAVLLNVTAIDPTEDGFLTAYPKLPRGVANPADPIRIFDDQSSFLPNYPNSSNLNFVAGDIVPNLVLARVGAGGKIRLKNYTGQTNVVADVVGWFDTGAGGGDGFTGITPTRVLDTRDGTGGIGGRFHSGESRDLDVAPAAQGAVPRDATAVVLNVTAVNPSSDGYVTVWPAGIKPPLTSSLNTQPGQTRPNLVVAKVGAGGAVSLLAYGDAGGSVDLVADVVGYFRQGGGQVVATDPQRLFDSRSGLNTPRGAFGPGEARAIQVVGQAGVPNGATAVVLNVTVTEPTYTGYITVYPAGAARPLASTLNYTFGQNIPNLVMVKLGPGGQVALYNSAGTAHLLADVVGYVH